MTAGLGSANSAADSGASRCPSSRACSSWPGLPGRDQGGELGGAQVRGGEDAARGAEREQR